VALLAGLLANAVQAQTQVWFDTNGTTSGTGNTSVTWGTNSGSYWSSNSNGTATPTMWNSAGGGSTSIKIANFSAGSNGTGSYTVTVSGTIDYVGGLTFEEGTVTLAGTGSLNLRQNANITVNATSATILSNITGSYGITKLGSGTLTLTGSKTYTGATNIGTSGGASGGTLALGGSNVLPSTAVNIYAGTLSLGSNSDTIGALTLGGGASGTTAAVTGSGTLTLGGNVTFDATNNPNGATISANLALGANRTFTIGDSSAAAADLTVSGVISNGSGTRALTKSGAGTLLLSGANTYTGATTISQGTIAVGANAPSGSAGALGNATSAIVVNNASTGSANTGLTIATSGVTINRAINVANNGTGTVTLGGDSSLTSGTGAFTGNVTLNRSVTLQAAGTSNVTFGTGVISGAGGITKTGTGTVTLTSVNTFTGGVTVGNGTLVGTSTGDTTGLGGFKAFGNYSGVTSPTDVITVNSGATLSVQGQQLAGAGNASTNSYLNLVLNGTGYNGLGALRSTGGNSTWTGNTLLKSDATITNAAASGDNDLLFLGAYAHNTASNVALNGHTLTLNGTGDVYITSKVGAVGGDTGSVVINGGTDATTVYYGGYANTYTGATTVNRGRLELQIDPTNPNNSAILGNLTIGSGSGSTTATVTDYYGEQIADTSTVTINKDGTLDLSSHAVLETIGTLVLNGGTVTTGTGELHIASGGGAVDVNTAGTSTISGKFRFQGTNGVFDVDTASTLMLSANLFGTNIEKTGAGTMIMTFDNKSNGYTGTTTVSQGTLNIRNSGALGSLSAGTTVTSGATLQLENTSGNVQVGSELLTLSGTGYNNQGALDSKSGADNRWAGAITLADSATIKTDAGNFTINGSVSGTAATSTTQTLTVGGAGNTEIHGPIDDGVNGGVLGLSKVDSGTLTLSGVDTFTGAINVGAGTVQVTANNVLGATTNAVNVSSGATFGVSGGNSYTNTIGAITGSGTVSIAASTNLVVNNTAADTFDGKLSGSGLFKKTGSGTLTFSSTSNTSAFNFNGTVQLDAGTMEFQGGTVANRLSINTLKLNGGTIYLNAATINVTTLNITADTILDFGTGGASILNAANIYIAAGVTLTIKNWSGESDFLFANSIFSQNDGSGTVAGYNQIGQIPENQIHFEGTNSADGSYTTWINYNYLGYTNYEIRPIPEPSTYGALLLGGCLGLFGWLRLKRRAGSKNPKA